MSFVPGPWPLPGHEYAVLVRATSTHAYLIALPRQNDISSPDRWLPRPAHVTSPSFSFLFFAPSMQPQLLTAVSPVAGKQGRPCPHRDPARIESGHFFAGARGECHLRERGTVPSSHHQSLTAAPSIYMGRTGKPVPSRLTHETLGTCEPCNSLAWLSCGLACATVLTWTNWLGECTVGGVLIDISRACQRE